MAVEFWDPLGFGLSFPFEKIFYPLGFPVLIRTNERAVLFAAAESFPENGESAEPALTLELRVGEGDFAAPTFAARGNLLLAVGGRDCYVAADCERAFGYGIIPRGLLDSRVDFRYFYLEFLAYTLLSDRFVTPIHGSCLARGGRGALLSAPSGTGKSCLAYACARGGLEFVSDDVVYLKRQDTGLFVLGRPHSLRVSPDAVDLFPELRDHPPQAHAGGEQVLEIKPSERPGWQSVSGCDLTTIYFLNRGAEPRVVPVEPQQSFERLVKELPRARAGVFEQQLASLERLSKLPAFELRYQSTGSAVDVIRDALSSGRVGR